MLSADQVVALASDRAVLVAGRELARPGKWSLRGRDAVLLWGLCRGSGSQPYRVTIEHAATEYSCTCPSRKVPCKHVVALLLLAAAGDVETGRAPDFALEWLVRRETKRRAASRATAAAPAQALETDAVREAAAAKRTQARAAKVAAGLDEMDRWLGDLARLGLANVRREPAAFWNAKAARLVDAQAPGLARRVRALGERAAHGEIPLPELVAAFGALHSLGEAYARIETLPPARRADVRRHLGFTQREEDATARPDAHMRDRWTVVGARSDDEERVTGHRAWLAGERTGRFALVLQFVAPGSTLTPLAVAVPAGAAFEGTLAYFEAGVPQRAVLVERGGTQAVGAYPGGVAIGAMLDAYARDVARDPWFTVAPAALALARLVRNGDAWLAVDAAGAGLPLASGGHDPYVLQALCGGVPTTLYAEWNGAELLPLGAVADGRYVRL